MKILGKRIMRSPIMLLGWVVLINVMGVPYVVQWVYIHYNGVPVMATVSNSYQTWHSTHLILNYSNPSGQHITSDVSIAKRSPGVANRQVAIHYLPNRPSWVVLDDDLGTKWQTLLIGIVLILFFYIRKWAGYDKIQRKRFAQDIDSLDNLKKSKP